MIVLLRRQFDLCSIVAAQSLSCLLASRFGYFSSFSQKPSSERASGVGFAIPSNRVATIVPQIISTGSVTQNG